MIGLVSRTKPDDIARIALYRPGIFGRPFIRLMREVMRGRSDWTVGERELFAAFVSRRNSCTFCTGIHCHVASIASGGEMTVDLLDDWMNAPFSEPVKATLGALAALKDSTGAPIPEAVPVPPRGMPASPTRHSPTRCMSPSCSTSSTGWPMYSARATRATWGVAGPPPDCTATATRCRPGSFDEKLSGTRPVPLAGLGHSVASSPSRSCRRKSLGEMSPNMLPCRRSWSASRKSTGPPAEANRSHSPRPHSPSRADPGCLERSRR